MKSSLFLPLLCALIVAATVATETKAVPAALVVATAAAAKTKSTPSKAPKKLDFSNLRIADSAAPGVKGKAGKLRVQNAATFPANPTYAIVANYDDSACSVYAGGQSMLLDTCLVGTTGSVKATCSSGTGTMTSYTDTACSQGASTTATFDSTCSADNWAKLVNCDGSDGTDFGSGTYFSTITNQDSSCKQVISASGIVNGHCEDNGDGTSTKFDWPSVTAYGASSDCTGAVSSTIGVSDTTCTGPNVDDDYGVDYNSYTSFAKVGKSSSGSSSCFHESTVINYHGKSYSLKDFESGAEPECVVPHVISSVGVKLVTQCGSIDVTKTHLLLGEDGYETAESFAVGDVILGANGKQCKVTKVIPSSKPANYFGLNCLSSEVTVGDLRVSTFGNYHALPATYMHVAGRVLGIGAASFIGKSIAAGYFAVVNLF